MGLCFAKEKLAKEETDMAQTIQECLDYLAAARESVEELSLAADREEQLKQDENRLKKAMDTEKKQMSDAVGTTVKKRREELNSSYDTEISKAQDLLKKARARREKARNQGVKERIAEETSIDSFIAGFELAWKLSVELNHYENERSVSCQTAMGSGARFASKEAEK